MSEGDWRDPFSDDDDEAARERARRRAEREARRRERRQKLGEEVRGAQAARPQPDPEGSPDPQPPDREHEPGPQPEPKPAAPAEPPREPRSAPVPPPPQPPPEVPTPEPPPQPPPESRRPEPSRAGDEPQLGDDPEPDADAELDDDLDPETDLDSDDDLDSENDDDLDVPPPIARRSSSRSRGGGRRPDSSVIQRRRLLAFGLLAAALALAMFGAATVADRLGSDGAADEPPAAAEEAVETMSVTIPEGMDRRQIAAVADDAGLRGNYVRASRQAQGFNPGRFGADGADHLEGFLFPATYELEVDAHVNDLIEAQLDAFRERIEEVNMRRAGEANLDVYDVLKIASMIEREVQIPRERRLVSAVIYNRLQAGNPLGIDATIRYEDENYDEPLTESRLNDPTPYNTRTNAGLPPTPIGNPGIETIRAAANPADVDYFYYVVEPYTCGEHVFTESEAEFQEAVAEYQRALAEEGGAPTPDDC